MIRSLLRFVGAFGRYASWFVALASTWATFQVYGRSYWSADASLVSSPLGFSTDEIAGFVERAIGKRYLERVPSCCLISPEIWKSSVLLLK